MLRFDRKQNNSVKQLSFSKKINLKNPKNEKQHPTTQCVQETPLPIDIQYRLKVNGWKKICQANTNQKKTGVTILISDRASVNRCSL